LLGKRKQVGGGVFHGPIIGKPGPGDVATWTAGGASAGAPDRNNLF
jgi:hypothetical protein